MAKSINIDPELKKEIIYKTFALASQALGQTSPNPLVGAVLVAPNGKILASDFYHKYQGQHAEELVLKKIKKVPEDAILFVNFEPCSKRTLGDSCVDLIIKKGVKNLIYACEDPHMNGLGGVEKLKKNGVLVEKSIIEPKALWFNRIFIRNIKQKESFFTAKLAIALDGKIALANFKSQWISDPLTEEKTQELRAMHTAVMVGANTINKDNSRLSIRRKKFLNLSQPARIVVSQNLSIDKKSLFFTDNSARRIIVSNNKNEKKINEFKQAGIEFIAMPGIKINFKLLKKELLKLKIYSVLIEGGAELFSELYKQKALDALHLFIAPKIIGADGIGLISDLKIKSMASLKSLKLQHLETIADDIYCEYSFKTSN